MKLKSGCFLQHLHLLLKYTACTSVRNAAALMEHFQLLDVHRKNYLNGKSWHNELIIDTGKTQASHKGDLYSCASEMPGTQDLQFYCFLCYVTDLNKDKIMLLFDLLDRNARGRICFNEFYMVVCTLLSHENDLEKQFIRRHAGPAFQLLDVDRDNMIDFNEFEAKRFLFNIQKDVKKMFKDIGISGDEQLNYREFKIFAVFCIDKQ
ncbi:EF-hand calcium-binding domain-containing protein 9 [Aquila chrysaetos chrysaetos]|uniref:EF-hand calcium-binding domain-containing protein 9 n=1 Tax=Aquila chrysaetos chrysaetos TaxID=223781 RepID=UPI00117730F5|nr:EF-hand calcium-binding domain-containing protein 9 [Aquila chrysaetos chrysaetos]